MQNRPAGDRILILVPFKQHTNRNTTEELNILLQKGFSRLYINQEVVRIEDLLSAPETIKAKKQEPKLPKNNSFLLIDRIVIKDFDEDDMHRLADSIGTAFYEGEGQLLIEINGEEKVPFSNRFELDGIRFE